MGRECEILLAVGCLWGVFAVISAVTYQSGWNLCALDKASITYGVEDLDRDLLDITVPYEALCSWTCQRLSNCTAFNWKQNSTECELYLFIPTKFGLDCDCVHFTVRISTIIDSHSHCVRPYIGLQDIIAT